MKKRSTIIIITFAILLLIFTAVQAETTTVVIMGYFSDPGMLNGAEDGAEKSGYAYECMQEVAVHAGWQYNYVYGTFAELYDKLAKGEIDILPYVSASEERRSRMLFPDRSMIDEELYLASPEPLSVSDDYHELNGKRIACVEGYFHNGVIVSFIGEHGLEVELRTYRDNAAKWEAVRNGEADLAIESSLVMQPFELYPVCRIGDDIPAYSAISLKRPDLLEQFNTAQQEVDTENPSFISSLRVKYFKNIPLFKALTEKDLDWLEEHQVLRIGVFNNDAPLIYTDENGKVTGVMPDYVKRMFENYGIDLPLEWKFYNTNAEAVAGLHAGEIDVIHPYYTSYNVAEKDGVIVSSTVYRSPMSLLYIGSFTPDTMKRVATPVTRLGAYYVAENYPSSVIVPSQNGYDCIDKLLAGEADSVVLNATALKKISLDYNKNFNIKTLHTLCSCSFAALPENSAVIDIINRAAPFLADTEVNEIEASYYVESDTRITVREFFIRNPGYMAGTAAFLAAVLAGFVFSMVRRNADRKKQAALEAALKDAREANIRVARQQEQMEESDRIISALSEDFGCVNYVQLKNNEADDVAVNYRSSRTLRRLIPEWADETNFKNKMLLLYDRLVFEEDKERFLRGTSREVVIENLRDENVCFCDFRLMLSDEPQFHQMKFSAVRDHGELTGIVAGIHSVDDDVRRELNYQQRIAEEEELLNEVLADEGVFLIDCVKDTRRTFHDRLHGADYYPDTENYSNAFGRYVNEFVCEPDREMMKAFVDPAFLLSSLGDRKETRVTYRDRTTGTQRFYEMRVIRFSETEVLQSFRENDAEMVNDMLFTRLKDNYFAVFGVDLESGLLRSYKDDPLHLGGEEGRISTLSSVMLGLASRYDGEAKEFFEKYSDPQNIKEKFLKEDRAEFVTKSSIDETKWVDVTGIVFTRNPEGVPSLFCLTFNYLDEEAGKMQDMQEQLREALEMAQSANRAKATFLTNMSHDIRTPMNAIIGFTGLAASHIDNKVLVQDYLGKIVQSSEHLLSLINDVLDMSRIESGKIHIEEREENLPEIIHTLRDIVRSDVQAKKLDFYVDVVDIKDEEIICDKLRLNQVLLNVLSNAVKYTDPGGTITLRVTEKAVRENGYGSYQFRIRDNGIGMSRKFLEQIYDPFTRVKSSTDSGVQGTGLGMAITKNIVDMMGGTIEINSEPGKGTEVILDFDFMLRNAPTTSIRIPEFEGVRGLVVDDDAMTCLAVSNMLRDVGMYEEWCTSGKEAVIRAGEAERIGNPFMVYIIDWLMPDMNGLETTRQIRSVIGDEVPIIVLSAYDWADIEEEAREAGVTAFISKPMFPSDLYRTLKACIGQTDEEEKPAEAEYDFSGRRILLVDDNELNREIAEEVLTEEGFTVDSVEDGSLSVEMMKEKGPDYYDFILMDIQMPIMNGYDATRAIRAMYPDAPIPIIAVSANAFEEDKQLSLEAGMNEHVAKPIDVKALNRTLMRFLR